MIGQVTDATGLSQLSTEALKAEILDLVQDQDQRPLSQKVACQQNQLAPYFAELQRRNPYPTAEAQIPIILGVWTPIWSTIPFHDILPGRIRQQSYQIFHGDGYYANVAHYVPGHQLGFLDRLAAILVAYNLMVLQRFEARNGAWFIQNVGIEQAWVPRHQALTMAEADQWFTRVVQSKLPQLIQKSMPRSGPQIEHLEAPDLKDLNPKTAKKFQKTFLATPLLEHLYVDREFRLVKTQREAKQRASYTIAIRRD